MADSLSWRKWSVVVVGSVALGAAACGGQSATSNGASGNAAAKEVSASAVARLELPWTPPLRPDTLNLNRVAHLMHAM